MGILDDLYNTYTGSTSLLNDQVQDAGPAHVEREPQGEEDGGDDRTGAS